MIKIIVKVPGEEEVVHEFQDNIELLRVGRVGGNDIIINHHSVSSSHCFLQSTFNSYELIDNDSTNGTFYHNKQCSHVELETTDWFQVGEVKIEFAITSVTSRLESKEPIRVRSTNEESRSRALGVKTTLMKDSKKRTQYLSDRQKNIQNKAKNEVKKRKKKAEKVCYSFSDCIDIVISYGFIVLLAIILGATAGYYKDKKAFLPAAMYKSWQQEGCFFTVPDQPIESQITQNKE